MSSSMFFNFRYFPIMKILLISKCSSGIRYIGDELKQHDSDSHWQPASKICAVLFPERFENLIYSSKFIIWLYFC